MQSSSHYNLFILILPKLQSKLPKYPQVLFPTFSFSPITVLARVMATLDIVRICCVFATTMFMYSNEVFMNNYVYV
ncbi:hypothetical protein Lal_00038856 [Lupinus albus]|nr:hypothetical protein Lal_00038856 [Lupinus albus]